MHIGTLAHWREAARASAHIGSRRRACTEAGRSVGGSGGGESGDEDEEDEDEEETGREASLSPLLPAPAGGGALAGPPPGGPRRRGARGERPRPRGEAKGHLRRPCAPRGARRDGQCVWLCAGGGGGGGGGGMQEDADEEE
ncbi:unnamed protein product [Prorocentrum cordatum]|uniref:Uncharacterized protein n=1 Tax=Prorocentrum cordatum TaxID=2364126 RepID=A0ABN9PA48_9DINO|nr:unnamed protein product [Polarella glacialis]